MNAEYMKAQSKELERCVGAKVYESPVQSVVWRPERQRGGRSGRTLQTALLLVLGGVLIVFSARCVYRTARRPVGDEAERETAELIAALSAVPEEDGPSEEDVAAFHEYVHRFDKQYRSLREHWRRFLLFSENRRQLEAVRRRANNTVFGPSGFSDRDDEELRQLLIPHSYPTPALPADLPRFDTAPAWQRAARPAEFDWRDRDAVTGIKNQGQCGSCWSFSVVAVVESLHVIAGGARTKLSEQELLDCDKREMGCFGGFRPHAFQFVRENGLVPEEHYAYVGAASDCRLPALNDSRVFVDALFGFEGDEEAMADWVATRGPISVGVNVTREMFAYKGGVFAPSAEDCARRSLGSHALAVCAPRSIDRPPACCRIIFNIWKFTPLGFMWTSHGNFFINGGAARRQAVLKELRLHLRANYHKHEHGAVVLYPEGSRLFLVRESERRFAAKNGLAPFQHCVHPRSGAAHAVLLECGPSARDATRTVHGRPPMEFVVDCTLGYPRGEVVDLGAAMVGEWPRGDTHVAVHYAVHPVRPEWQDEGKLKDWLYARYAEKDRLLAEFYRTGRFPGKPRPVVFPLARSLLAELFWALVFYAHWSAWIRPLGALLGRQLWTLVA
ncbi:Acl-12 [Aphelenchoides fujianensis]|nr:Acl-12 [Aphelenchoides fujianensis]